MNLKRIFVIGLVLAAVAGCDTLGSGGKGPKIGDGADDYTPSPCACKEVQQRFKRQFVS